MSSLIFDTALRATPLLLCAWAITAVLRRSSADLRHRIWYATFCGIVGLMIPVSVPRVAQIPVAFTFVSDAVATPATRVFPWAIIWAAGAAIMLMRFAIGIYQLAKITRNAERTEAGDVRVTCAISSPLTWGIIHPSILLPAYAADWSPARRGIALQHERAHIERGDWLWQSFAQLVTAMFWFHPLVWLAAARLRQEAEHSVDDAVIASGAGAVSYAEQLLEVAKHVHTASPISAIAMVRQPSLTARIAAILDATRIRTKAGFQSRVAIAIAALCLVPLLAAFQQKSAEMVGPTMAKLAESMGAPSDSLANSGARAGGDVTAASLAVWNKQQSSRKAIVENGDRSYQGAPSPGPQPQPSPAPSPSTPPSQPDSAPNDDAQSPYKIGAGVSAPVPIFRVQPSYTDEARQLKVQGAITLSVVVDEFGVAQNVSVTEGIGGGLDEEGVAAVKQWRFSPGMKNGVPVAVIATIVINFKLL